MAARLNVVQSLGPLNPISSLSDHAPATLDLLSNNPSFVWPQSSCKHSFVWSSRLLSFWSQLQGLLLRKACLTSVFLSSKFNLQVLPTFSGWHTYKLCLYLSVPLDNKYSETRNHSGFCSLAQWLACNRHSVHTGY